MSETSTAETISADKTEAVDETNDEVKISAKEILTSKTEEIQIENQENLTETKETSKEEVSVVSLDTKSPQNENEDAGDTLPIETPQLKKDDNEKSEELKEVMNVTAKEVSKEADSSSDVKTATTQSSESSSRSEISSSAEETPLDKDSPETTLEEVSEEKVSPAGIPIESTNSSTEESQDKATSSSAKATPQETDLTKATEIVSIEIHSSSDVTSLPIKSPLKSPSSEEIQDKVTNATSSAQELLQDKNSSEIPTKETTKSTAKPSSKDEYAEHVTYTEDGSAIYTDPQTKYQYKWCTKANNWIPRDSNSATTNPYENEHYKWCSETQKWLPKKTQVTETEHYKWDAEKQEWIAKVKGAITTTSSSEQTANPSEIVYDIDEDGQRIYTDKDGAVFFWDAEKNAWFPKIDDDFMARYQMSYGFIDNTSESEREKEKREQESKLLKEQELEKLVEEAKANDEAAANAKQGVKRKPDPPKWFEIDPMQNTKVYVSNLPLDITLDEFTELMSKCGMIMRDPLTQKFKLKLYTEANGQIKGDGLCDYIKVQSVDLALKILDEYELRGRKIRVQQAQFQMRGEYNPALKPKRKKKDKEKLAKIKEKLFDWRPEKMRGERSKHEKTVIIKNLFHPELFEKEVQLILDYQNDLREECAKCGTVRKVVIYDRHSEGVAQINMASPEEADLVIQMMQGRFFGKRQLTAEHWDGKTKYKVEETEEEIQKRLNKWDQYLEAEENKKLDLQKEEKTELEKEEQAELQKVEQSELQKETQKDELSDLQMDDQSDLQKNEQSDLQNEDQSDLQKEKETDLQMVEQMELQRDEQDIEKTINFENTEKPQITQKVEDTQILEEKSKED